MKELIKQIIPSNFYIEFRKHYYNIIGVFIKFKLDKSFKDFPKILVIGVSDYGNLGDQAIGYAQRQFLENSFPNKRIVEVPVRTPVSHISKIVNEKDIFIFTGGGNLGDLYSFVDVYYIPLMKRFSKNKKIFMPQSATFTTSPNPSEYNRLVKTFAQNGTNLTITARETKSFEIFKTIFASNKVILTPDIVLTLDKQKAISKSGALVLFRKDSEVVKSDEDKKKKIISMLQSRFEVTVSDTVVEHKVKIEDRESELEQLWKKISEAEIVVTDRLHGMIFAIITGTPCLVFDNYNSKIKYTYNDWINSKFNRAIEFIDEKVSNESELCKLIEKVTGQDVPKFNKEKAYYPLYEAVKEYLE